MLALCAEYNIERSVVMSTSSEPVATTSIPHRHRLGRAARGRVTFNRALPFESVGWIAVIVDFFAIMATSILADVGYRWMFLNSGESDERFVGIGLLIFANFSAISAARGNYQPRNLLNFQTANSRSDPGVGARGPDAVGGGVFVEDCGNILARFHDHFARSSDAPCSSFGVCC